MDESERSQVEEDIQGKIEKYIKENNDLQNENQRMTDEFNSQRAKWKVLFLQKEDQIVKLKNELDDVKSQLVVDSIRLESDFEVEKRKAEEEIASLQRLVHETVEESSSTRSFYDQDLAKLQTYIQHLQKENGILKHELNQYQQASNQEHSLASNVVINACKGLAKKLGAEAFGSQEEKNIEKSQEDVEVLKSLVEPLEDQIKALKEKLRTTDEQLQKCRECKHLLNEPGKAIIQTPEKMLLQNISTNTSFDMQRGDNIACDMCSNYEAQLVKEQQNVSELKAKLQTCEKATERHKEDLIKEIGFRKEMEEKWNEKREEHKQQVASLTKITDSTEQEIKKLKQYFEQVTHEMRSELSKLTREREQIYKEWDKVQKENEHLVGKYTIHSQELQSEAINLPNTVEELHELVLKNHQDLIIAKVGKEQAEEEVNNLQSSMMLLRDQIESDLHERKTIEDTLDREIKSLQSQLGEMDKERKYYVAKYSEVSEKCERIRELEHYIKELEAQNSELKSRVQTFQHDLETNETVQRDFVRLSQNLQVQLEKIRESDNQVRWQHEEDVDECPHCRNPFTNTKKKTHCRHCGQIYCQSCLTKSVQSGPNLRPSRVCDVCHTLLVKSSAPYFSKEPPMT
ncbi:rab GTPase-binding effector protein 1-like isoform X2 [Rhynchophorus ferrugineus]|uniref:rab GTPase-binding effector protein 1-like isoform X2 n=1 Tax=Rhynchophorus ferrugineus TaxID=354439 RepID=UPI003FCCBE54